MADIIYTSEASGALEELLAALDFDTLLVVSDENTRRYCCGRLPILGRFPEVTLPAGEESKNIAAAEKIWRRMQECGLTRRSLIVNVGGGMITDLGGFAAALYMRGIRYVNVATSLLAAVDASVGGKTAVDFGGVKNLVGAFHAPIATIISPEFLSTLPRRELLSGFGEMLKHALLSGERQLRKILNFNPLDTLLSTREWLDMLRENIALKQKYAEADPYEKNIRKALNAGHTIGHALEALSLENDREPFSHGEAVARGLCFELRLSKDFPAPLREAFCEKVRELYGPERLYSAEETERILRFMALDKKNLQTGRINFTLMEAPGAPRLNCEIPREEIARVLQVGALRND